jgi:hypothetical protein
MQTKRMLPFFLLFLGLTYSVLAQDLPYRPKYEYQQITTVESVVPGGLGRSRMISTDKNGQLEETKLENFFSMVGINFGNIKENDLAITQKIQKMSDDGWELFQTNSASYGADKSTGIFITRYLFRRVKN